MPTILIIPSSPGGKTQCSRKSSFLEDTSLNIRDSSFRTKPHTIRISPRTHIPHSSRNSPGKHLPHSSKNSPYSRNIPHFDRKTQIKFILHIVAPAYQSSLSRFIRTFDSDLPMKFSVNILFAVQ